MDEERGRPRPPDIEAGATVRMKRLRVSDKPEGIETRAHGSPEIDTTSEGERENLPDELEAGETYRDARIRRHVEIRLTDA
jgi:hypothetical protein